MFGSHLTTVVEDRLPTARHSTKLMTANQYAHRIAFDDGRQIPQSFVQSFSKATSICHLAYRVDEQMTTGTMTSNEKERLRVWWQDKLGDPNVNTCVALHTAARRYCLERHGYWRERYSEIVRNGGDRQRGGYNYTAEALATFPRYNVLNAILVELERIDPVTLGDFETTRELLLLAGETAEDDFTQQPICEISERAISDERDIFCRYLSELKLPDLGKVERLPYRRVLVAEEAKSIWSRLRDRWQITAGYWYPLSECELTDVVAFKTPAFDEGVSAETLHDMFSACGIERVLELREYGPEYEEDLSLFEVSYNGAEGYWSSGDLNWIIYASHESSITVGGWILQEIKTAWPSWKTHVWTGVFD